MELELDWTSAGLEPGLVRSQARQLIPYIRLLRQAVASNNWRHPAASLLLPSEKSFLRQCLALSKKWPRPSLVIVVGIGGSSLGAQAVSQAVLGAHHNLLHPNHQLVFVDTVDGSLLQSIAAMAQRHLAAGGHVVLNAISKSGTTLETQVDFETLLSLLSTGRPARRLHVVVTSDAGSAFGKSAHSRGFSTLPIPKSVGGRYSVFSPVGLFPLLLCGVRAEALLEGARAMRNRCLDADAGRNPAALLATILSLQRVRGRTIHDHFLFSPDLAGIGLWCRQLMAESIGKEFDSSGLRPVHMGITPTVSIGSADLHSMTQLYLGGPSDKSFCLITLAHPSADLRVPASLPLERLVPLAVGRRAHELMQALFGGFEAALRAKGIPYFHICLPDRSESSIGALMQLEMMEMMMLARLLGVNAFDQPAVEEYKKEARALLEKMPPPTPGPDSSQPKSESRARQPSRSSLSKRPPRPPSRTGNKRTPKSGKRKR